MSIGWSRGVSKYILTISNLLPPCVAYLNLFSLATDTEYVRGRLAEYANDLLSLGVDGLRLDASKSMYSISKY